MSTPPRLRCAVYTRKSTEEGLDQDFNSLDAQREACEAFIASQASLGWKLVPDRYDDGGISGGTMERPALQRMLEDIKAGRIDVVVVYKIDRLTRSLMDFAKIVDILDSKNVSFAAVTQAFNTTTSMGRLTLNVLLSFAQFEREVTAERIRDKIAASKKKGIWMGGAVPFGYRVENRKLLINEDEAKTVRLLFSRYCELKSVRLLSEEATRLKLTTPRTLRRNGKPYGAGIFERTFLHRLLSNPIYVGKIRHKDAIYKGEQQPIIDPQLFETVRDLLATQAPDRGHATNLKDIHLLTGILFDETGDRLSPTHANRHGKRYRYYVSNRLITKTRKDDEDGTGWRIPALELDRIVGHELDQILANSSQLMKWTEPWCPTDSLHELLNRAEQRRDEWNGLTSASKRSTTTKLFRSITLAPNWIRLDLDRRELVEWLLGEVSVQSESDTDPIEILERPLSMRRRGVESRLILSNGNSASRAPDAALVDLILRANSYFAALTDGSAKSMAQIATEHGTDFSEVSRLLPLAFLSPAIVDAILTGKQPVELNAQRLSRITGLPNSWAAQSALIGLTA
ncbi:recombinase family protein [Hoeflea sp. AS60]|uniref:recombinase family protein n=1 Tax=Hoeflea sp. AS60 TaxID=3135780 RepID=UPI00317F3FF2